MKRRQLLASLAAWPLAAGIGRAMAAAESPGTAGRRSIAQMQQDWRQFLAKGADVAQSTAPLQKSEAEWKSSLPEQQFYVLRKEGTERPFTSPLNDEKRRGIFVCAGCALPHFTLGNEVRQRHRLAELFHQHPRASGDQAGLSADRAAHRISLRALRRATRVTCSTTARRRPVSAGATTAWRSALFRRPARRNGRADKRRRRPASPGREFAPRFFLLLEFFAQLRAGDSRRPTIERSRRRAPSSPARIG